MTRRPSQRAEEGHARSPEVAPTPHSAGDRYAFAALIEHAADGALVVDDLGVIQYANDEAARLLRHTKAELVGAEFGYPAIECQAVEIVVGVKPAPPSTLELRASDVLWHGRRASLITLRDVTARIAREQRITELNATLRLVLSVDDLILHERRAPHLLEAVAQLLNTQPDIANAKISIVDDRLISLATIGASRADVASTPPQEPLVSYASELADCCKLWLENGRLHAAAPPSADACETCTGAAATNGRVRIMKAISAEGDTFGYLSVTLAALRAEDDEQQSLVQRVAADLGHALRALLAEESRRRADEALSESETRFRNLFQRSTDAIVVADADGRFTDVNDAACAVLGYSRAQLLRMSVGDLEVDESQPSAAEQYRAYVPVGNQTGMFSCSRPDGSVRHLEYSAFQLSPNRFVSILRDVTDRRRLEAQLQQAQKMEAVGQLAGGIAHDFNNLLTAIISFADFARDALPNESTAREDLDEVLRASDRATDLTRQLLAFSRRQPIAPRLSDLSLVVNEANKLLRRTLGEDIELVMNLATDVPVFIDPAQFEQIVLNLALNARDAMPHGGTLTIETEARNEMSILRVRDTGEGMTSEVKAHLFEPFFTTKERGKGTGLGLAMVYGLVSQAGGTIHVTSEIGEGSTFEICLPPGRHDQAAPAPSLDPPASTDGTESILIVEDEPLVREATCRILAERGYVVYAALDTEHALKLAAKIELSLDLVLCDVIMPRASGPAVVQAIRAIRPDIKIMFMTGYVDNDVVDQIVHDLNIELLQKPFTRRKLLEGVRRVLGASTAPRKANSP